MFRRTFASSLIPALLVLAVAIAASAQATKDTQATKVAPATQAAQATKTAPAAKGLRPDQFKPAPLNFKTPKASDYRTTLSNGLVVYIAEDHEIPWFSARMMVRTGPFLEPQDKLGVEDFVPAIIRSGGSTTMTGEQINERMDFLAGNVSATSLSIHTRHLDEGLKIWMDILTNPAFPEDKLRRERDPMLVQLRNRNRNISNVAGRTYSRLIYGENSPITAEPTETTLNAITRSDLVEWHKKYWGANNAILVVTGDFKKADMLKKLDASFGQWRNAEKAVPPVPKVQQAAKAGVYMVQPEGATPNQGIIQIGHLGLTVDDPDYPAVDVMNYILGGGSFSSRITKVVRTDNGLAYSTSSSFGGGGGGRGGRGGGGGGLGGIKYPGTFTASCQTKNATVVFAAQLILDLIEGVRAGDVSEADLKMAKSARINAFPAQFPSIDQIVGNFAQLEFNDRPAGHYDNYLAKYEKITLADVKRVAQKYLKPDQMIIMVAGNINECKAGADNMLPNQPTIDRMAAKFGGRTIEGLARKYGDGTVHVISLRGASPTP